MLVFLALTILGVRAVLEGRGNFLVWAMILIFALGFLAYLFQLVRERLSGKPHLLITDKAVFMDTGIKSYEIPFADVDAFVFSDTFGDKMISILYTPEAEARHNEETLAFEKAGRKLKKFFPNTPVGIPTSDLSMSPVDILEFLDERLEAAKKAEA